MAVLFGTHAAQNERAARGYQLFWPGVHPLNVAPPTGIHNRILLRQEQPWHPPGQWFQFGVQGPNVRPPVKDAIIVRQELPDHPGNRFAFGVQGPNVANPSQIAQRLIVRQELPWHPGSSFVAGVQGPNVANPSQIAQRLIVRQELPWHPASRFHIAPPPVRTQLPFVPAIMTTQQRPDHPRSSFHAGTPPLSYEDVEVFIIH